MKSIIIYNNYVIIKYKNEKLKSQYEDKKWFIRNFNLGIWKKYVKFKERIRSQENMSLYAQIYKKDGVESLQGRATWAIKLNDKYRVEFEVNSINILEIKEIKIIEVHPHKYKK